MIWASRVTRRKSSILPGRDVHFKKKKTQKQKTNKQKYLYTVKKQRIVKKNFSLDIGR